MAPIEAAPVFLYTEEKEQSAFPAEAIMKEKTTSYRKNPNGSYTRTGKIVQRPEDGWQESQGASIERRKGWGVWFTWETDDPKYTRPGLVIFLLFFIAIFTAIFWCAWEAARTPSQQIFSITVWAGFLGWTLYVGNGLRKAINRREAEQQAAVRAEQEKKRLARLADTALPEDRELAGQDRPD